MKGTTAKRRAAFRIKVSIFNLTKPFPLKKGLLHRHSFLSFLSKSVPSLQLNKLLYKSKRLGWFKTLRALIISVGCSTYRLAVDALFLPAPAVFRLVFVKPGFPALIAPFLRPAPGFAWPVLRMFSAAQWHRG